MSVAMLSCLTASTMNFDATGRGGAPELTRAEMAGMLAGLGDGAMHFAMAKYCGDMPSFKQLQFHLIYVAAGFAADHGWKASKGKPCIISLGCLAAFESADPLLCFACNTIGLAGGKACSCAKPRKSISGVDRARYVDVGIRQWNSVWRDRYGYLFQYCFSLDSQVRSVVVRG